MKAKRRFVGVLLVVLVSGWVCLPGCRDKDKPKDVDNAKEKDRGDAKELTLNLGDGVTMKLVRIPAGTFMMGRPASESRRDSDAVRHRVTISKPFYMGVHEITRGQFEAFVADSGYKTTAEKEGWICALEGTAVGRANGASWRKPGFTQTNNHPVVCVSWDDAKAFCDWFGRKSGKTVRLAAEAEWEYACRGGTTTRFSFGDRDGDLHKYGNYCDKSNTSGLSWRDKTNSDGYDKTAPVGSFKPNAFGLYDMHGNVWEWCGDWYKDSYLLPGGANADTRDPKGPKSGSNRVLRGGCWFCYPRYCRSAYRYWYFPHYRFRYIGFRVVVVSPLN